MRLQRLRWLSPAGFLDLAWWEWGPADGRPVICVHGLTRNGRDFDALATALAAQGRRVLCPDLPGRGESGWLPDPGLYQPPTYVSALGHLLARLDGEVDWVGTSLGGICGIALASLPGTPIRRLVLNDIGSHVPREAIARIRDYLGGAIEFPGMAALEAHLRRVHAPFGPLSDAEWQHLAAISARPTPGGGVVLHYDPAIAVPILGAEPAAIDLEPFWQRVAAPTLVLRGAASDLLLPETAAEMARRPGVQLAEIEGCGHAPALMAPEQVALVAGFLSA